MAETFRNVVVSFFKKADVYLLSAFIIPYRAGEGQIIKVGPLFLEAMRSSCGLGPNSKQVGTIYGVFSSAAFILGLRHRF